MTHRPIRKILAANRSEIATRVFRSAHELGIRTVAMYSHEDRFALHRFKADEAYSIGKVGEPIRSYLDIEGIVELCLRHNIDAVHPGYGFLAENPTFAEKLEQAGIIFVGPSVHALRQLGDKVAARDIAIKAGVPVLPGSSKSITSVEEALQVAASMGYPIMLKAAKGGGGRGMRMVDKEADLPAALESAQRESLNAFGSDEVFVEKLVRRARHFEVQLLGDDHGSLIHLHERDCSVQRRHQKVVELAPAPNLAPAIAAELHSAALAIGNAVGYRAAGTVEFLYDTDAQKFYFIEVNPRIQVEHTVTEEVTGIDLVRAQILVAMGHQLGDESVGLPLQNEVAVHGFAMQCRVTTEDPANQFRPDYGRITHYRSAGGLGIRLDAGSAFSGAVVNPFYDSMLVKVTARGRTLREAAGRMERCLQEFRIRGVKTNIPFLIRMIGNEIFLNGEATTRLIDSTPELFELPARRDRATRVLRYLANVVVNGNELVKGRPVATRREPAPIPKLQAKAPLPKGTRDLLKELGPERFSQWIRDEKSLLITDTTMRDAHQSLLATRLRTYDMLQIAETYAHRAAEFFSLEMWGGATFDTSMRFLKESPWQRLTQMRERCPNILFQMLLRASNAVGYTNYPDNVVKAFVKEAADAGIDVFRVFDALNWVDNMQVAMEAVLDSGAICEASICYSGDILNPARQKYSLKYYVDLAKHLEKLGAHILAIKDMAGLCKPAAARQLIKALKQEIGIPIHFHTHDTAGLQAASILAGAEEDLDIADAALASLSGGTSQVNLNTLVESLRFGPRDSALSTSALTELSTYWKAVREFYLPFESEALAAGGDLYEHEMPGGQYTNLYQQARALGLADRWTEVCKTYAEVNQMFGDIVKVTPTSKAVGDMALFMVAGQLTATDVLNADRDLSPPASVVDLLSGMMGQPPGGFPPQAQKAILRDRPLVTGRPGASLPPADFEATREKLTGLLGVAATDRECVTHLLYPKVYEDFIAHRKLYGDVSTLQTPYFFYGADLAEEIIVDIEEGKRLIIRFLAVGQPKPDGTRTVFFELNGQPREVEVIDHSMEDAVAKAVQADPANPTHVAASMPGMVIGVSIKAGDTVKKGDKLLTLEAMKMETTISAESDGQVSQLLVKSGSQVEAGDLLLVVE
ncbi:pyruvate carboxylase [Aureliella helgolandensis]|uniref:Pyruvate carboxylase n=1 Tax=Aureliella helgolandensis TaxID=2527968 RepID=A0A518G156_9BACT|nr:pyruvate carboxylase [Aureliella helgolandensis]QDV22270.1 2-oxoglutarate carboxylase small subunit [Aureliella helgolandensis]